MKNIDSHLWNVSFEIGEDADCCEVKAHLNAGDRSLSGFGRARRNPADPSVPQIGEELATARAIQDLAHRLLDDVHRMIDEVTTDNEPANS
jgi:hypothetical protein